MLPSDYRSCFSLLDRLSVREREGEFLCFVCACAASWQGFLCITQLRSGPSRRKINLSCLSQSRQLSPGPAAWPRHLDTKPRHQLDTSTPHANSTNSTPLDTPRHHLGWYHARRCQGAKLDPSTPLDTPRHPSTPPRHRSTPLDTARTTRPRLTPLISSWRPASGSLLAFLTAKHHNSPHSPPPLPLLALSSDRMSAAGSSSTSLPHQAPTKPARSLRVPTCPLWEPHVFYCGAVCCGES